MAHGKEQGLAVIFGKGAPGKKGAPEPEMDMDMELDAEDEYDAEFDTAATEALGTDDPEKIAALKRAIMACMEQ